MGYDYFAAMYEDIMEYITENIELSDYETKNELENFLNNELWTVDSVTGNGSGSYTFNGYKAEAYICHNLDLLAEAVEAFGRNVNVLKDGAEACDVTIRCYLLPQVISSVLVPVWDEYEESISA